MPLLVFRCNTWIMHDIALLHHEISVECMSLLSFEAHNLFRRWRPSSAHHWVNSRLKGQASVSKWSWATPGVDWAHSQLYRGRLILLTWPRGGEILVNSSDDVNSSVSLESNGVGGTESFRLLKMFTTALHAHQNINKPHRHHTLRLCCLPGFKEHYSFSVLLV